MGTKGTECGEIEKRRQSYRGAMGLEFKGKLTSICNMRMGSASWRVMVSGDFAVAKVLSGGVGKSKQPYSFLFCFSRHGFSVVLEPVLELALVDQAGLKLT